MHSFVCKQNILEEPAGLSLLYACCDALPRAVGCATTNLSYHGCWLFVMHARKSAEGKIASDRTKRKIVLSKQVEENVFFIVVYKSCWKKH